MASSPEKNDDDFTSQASGKERGIVAEFIAFMAENKLWWMAPLLLVFLLVGALVVLGGSGGISAFLYTLF